MILITGTQRSGTMFLASVLYKAGFKATHEGNIPGRNWNQHDPRRRPRTDVDIDVCWHSAWWLRDDVLKDAYVVHLVRHPLEVISSSMHRNTFTNPSPSGKWAINKMPWIGIGSNIERCAKYYASWNYLIENNAHKRIRIEDISPQVIADILEAGQINYDLSTIKSSFESTSKTTNTNKNPKNKITWDDIEDEHLRKKVKQMALNYGYE